MKDLATADPVVKRALVEPARDDIRRVDSDVHRVGAALLRFSQAASMSAARVPDRAATG